ncbi:hypothetical protein DFP72DRAFT_803511 [Ephemerocybe angulata]|uniref:CCZ1/INTU/HSP4 first Longin domain-containing protein n=1 Tax=Ephemerocybe angulata TaxID=980116 RepID=A0A8H6IDA9_9AGAR|nr:hypothetical protein DFP72DRAFT_803511 [Tulosesus angulatus]
MLRQIGLAKALVNFAELFNANDKCESIHSQSRRMVLVSPEPNFWFIAAVELPKKSQSSSSSSSKSTVKGKPKASTSKAQPAAEVVYDYEEGTVHDLAIRSQILHGYEKFKLLHGSFTSILDDLGQEGLETQLERFFTPWAWSWNLEAKPQIAELLGLPLQPYHSSLTPLLDGYSATLPETVIPVVLSQTHIIPSTRYISAAYPSALAEYLMAMIPPPTAHAEDPIASSVDTIQQHNPDSKSKDSTGLFSLPTVNMNVNMDMRKWNWQSYLTFGKGGAGSSKSKKEESKEEDQKDAEEVPVPPEGKEEVPETSEEDSSSPKSTVELDSKALEDALSSEGSLRTAATSESEAEHSPEPQEGGETVAENPDPDTDTVDETDAPSDEDSAALQADLVSSSPQSSMTILPRPRAPSTRSPTPVPTFTSRRVYLASSEDSIATKKREVHYYIRNATMIALVADPGPPSPSEMEEVLSVAAEHVISLLDDIEITTQNAALSKLSESLPTASKILQTPDQYAISTGRYFLQSPGFTSNSSHLQNATALMDMDPDVLEVYSRGQNPQYWHVAKRGLSTSEESPSTRRGTAYLEVFKKEASLPDVDNVLAGILRKSGIAESGLL